MNLLPFRQSVPTVGKLTRLKIILAILFVAAPVAVLGVLTWGVATATHPGGDHLVAAGPVNPQTHFPEWYRDSTGLTLALCVDDPVLCIADPVDPNNELSVETGFGGEAFWWAADASMPVGIGGSALLVLATEAAYANEDPEPGAQMTFGRIRVRASGLVTGATYTVIHPFGQDTYVAADAANNINDSADIGCNPIPPTILCDFSLALLSNVGPFLVWDPAVAPAAPAGFIGDPAIDHQVVGSPFGTNFFRIEGPNAGGLGVDFAQTNLFAVQGKIFDNPPVAVNDVAIVGAVSTGHPINVLANDSDPDGDPVIVTAVTQPASGSVVIGPGGANVIFTPAVAGPAVFGYTATSTKPGFSPQSAEATVTVTVVGPNVTFLPLVAR